MRLAQILIAMLIFLALPLMAEDEKDEKTEEEAPPTINYYQVKPSLVANLATGGKYIRCDIQLMTNDELFLEDLTLHGPAIRHTLLLLLTEQDGRKIKTPDGKEALRKEALSVISKLMQDLSGKEGIKALFFTTFLVQ
ncbi:MAG: flagellar basal body-associated FliL family protein [Candidatus Thiodiazotropha sp. (ex Codakia rugifera)]|nr:flagellar basal body-associated FliL family protein [Candidatus Thiodiazotropha sp. (ex Codakia rugifera)]